MSRPRSQATGYRFDEFFLDARNRQLWRAGQPLALNSKYFDVLLMLVAHRGELIEKQRIFDEVWDGVFVTDAALTQCIKDIRRKLGDDASSPRYIRTVPKHGYVFIADAVEADAEVPGLFQSAPRPYKFLDYFTEQDAQLFFGRQAEVEVISSQVLVHRSFILHGRSGVGKSSLLRAGLMARLKSKGHRAFVIRSFSDPLHKMISALREAEVWDAVPVSATEKVSIGSVRSLTVLLLDQFEEFFLLLDEAGRRRFIDEVAALLSRKEMELRFVFAIREDFLAEMSQFKSAIPEIFHHEYRLRRLNPEQAALAITEPARAVGCEIEPALVSRLLLDLSDGNSIDPPQLQIVCDRLYDARDRSGRITLAQYEGLGTGSQILAGYLQGVLNRFDAPELQTARALLTTLISNDGRRLVLRPVELEARVRSSVRRESRPPDSLIEELVAARIVRCSREDGETWIELAHDFLTAEVAGWATADERSLKQARGVIERAMENYRGHQLIMDADALDLVLPFGDQLGLTDEEADLLVRSALIRGRALPEWLIRSGPCASHLIEEATRHPEAVVRVRAVEACRLLASDTACQRLKQLALRDPDLGVRKAASIELARSLGERVFSELSAGGTGGQAGLIRRAICLAMIRDYDRRLVNLYSVSLPVGVLIVLGLIWVRLRRGGALIIRQAIGGTLGGAASGAVGGLILGLGLATAQQASALEGTKLVLALVSLGIFIGAIGALGVSCGMVAASQIAYRHSRWWSVVGAGGGGAILGGVFKLLSIDILSALFGRRPSGLTGALEGAVMGVGVSLGAVLVGRLFKGARMWQIVSGAAVGAMGAGIVLTVVGGNLFSGSLEIVARSFADSQIRMDPLAPLFGEVRFGQTMQIAFGAIEGLLFGAGMTTGIRLVAESAGQRVGGRSPA
jgi:DNA-binding winged helix-turn-helix (wHTH) protein